MTRFAVYGTLKQNRGNHHRLDGAQYLGNHITDPNYTMYACGGFPAVKMGGNTPITVEVYETNNENIVRGVNNLEGFTGIKDDPENWYDTITINTPYGEAEMFYMKQGLDRNPIVENGIW